MNNDTPFPFHTTKEAWDYFTKAARMHFVKLLKKCMEEDPSLRQKIKTLTDKDYCARLLYILNMFTFEGNQQGEFDLDWAMLMAKPMSAAQARKSIDDLLNLGLMGELDIEDLDEGEYERPTNKLLSDGTHKKRIPPQKSGGSVSPKTKFNFD